MVLANGFVYAVGGEWPFSEHDDIEVHCKYLHYKQSKKHLVCLNLLLISYGPVSNAKSFLCIGLDIECE